MRAGRHNRRGPWGQLVKAVSGSGSTPPPGYVPVPKSKVGLWHKKVGDGYVYWKPKAPTHGIDHGTDLPPMPQASKPKLGKLLPGLTITAQEFDKGIPAAQYMLPPVTVMKPVFESLGWQEVEPGVFEKSYTNIDAKTKKPITLKPRFDVYAPMESKSGGIPYEVAEALGPGFALGVVSRVMGVTTTELHAAALLGYKPNIQQWSQRVLGLSTASNVSTWKKGEAAPADVKAVIAALEAAKKKKEPKHPTEIEDEKWETAEAAKERKAMTYTAPPPGRNDYPSDHEQLNEGVRLLTHMVRVWGKTGTLKELIEKHPELPLTDILDAVTLFTAGHVPSCRDASKYDASKAPEIITGVDLSHYYNRSTFYKVKPTHSAYVFAGDMLMDLAAVPFRGTSTLPIGRGMRLPPAALKKVAVGQVLELGKASSFSKSADVVDTFMNNPQNDIPDHWPKVKLVFDPGTLKRGCDVSALSKYGTEQEVIVGGQIRITGKKLDRKTGVTTLTVVQDDHT